jgi:hypothetical protein
LFTESSQRMPPFRFGIVAFLERLAWSRGMPPLPDDTESRSLYKRKVSTFLLVHSQSTAGYGNILLIF